MLLTPTTAGTGRTKGEGYRWPEFIETQATPSTREAGSACRKSSLLLRSVRRQPNSKLLRDLRACWSVLAKRKESVYEFVQSAGSNGLFFLTDSCGKRLQQLESAVHYPSEKLLEIKRFLFVLFNLTDELATSYQNGVTNEGWYLSC